VQPDAAGDALLQQNDETAATVNRLRLSGVQWWSAIGQSAALGFVRAFAPPAVLLVMIALMLNVSIAVLFAAFVPFSILAGVTIVLMATSRNTENELAVPAMEFEGGSLMWVAVPFIVVGAVLIGIATPLEAGALAIAVALVLGLAQHQLSGQRLLRSALDSVQDTGSILLVVIFALCLSYALAAEEAPAAVTQWMLAIGAWPALLCAVLAICIASAVVGPLPTLFVLTPLLLPAMNQLGVDPIRFAMVFAIAISLGLLVPPLGPIFASLAAGTTERSSRVAFAVGYFSLAGLLVLAMAVYGPIWTPS
jgi:TRAP-type C4-dicarboxylate transport system permease large subunit